VTVRGGGGPKGGGKRETAFTDARIFYRCFIVVGGGRDETPLAACEVDRGHNKLSKPKQKNWAVGEKLGEHGRSRKD